MSEQVFTVGIIKIVEQFKLEEIYVPENMRELEISSSDVNRPGIQIAAGYYDYFDSARIQIFGKVEHAYMEEKSTAEKSLAMEQLFEKDIPALVVTRGLDIFPEIIQAAQKHKTPLLRTSMSTSNFMSSLIAWLNVQTAPRITRHGVLVEVYGEGVLILGESGAGKSETAIELVKRGHRLVADDAVEIKRVSAIALVGSAPEIIRHFIEIRGIGIVDVRKIFGMGSVKDTERIDMIIHIEQWKDDKVYDRLGIDDEYTEILGINVPSITVPIRPGRNLAVIVEVAAMNQRQKRMGYNAATELTERLNKQMNLKTE